jgi:hypothetical protein
MPVDIEAIRVRADAAMPGPWGWFGNVETDTVHLATNHSGRMYILAPRVRHTESVYCSGADGSLSIEEARERLIRDPATLLDRTEQVQVGEWGDYDRLSEDRMLELAEARGIDVLKNGTGTAADVLTYIEGVLCGGIWDDLNYALGDYDEEHDTKPSYWTTRQAQDALRDFLAGEMHDGDAERHLRGLDGHIEFYRGLHYRPDMAVQQRTDDGPGWMVPWCDVARYEVLNGRTLAEHEAAGGRINGERRDLYRQDIVGLDNPEAEFIAHARQDVDDLLAEVDRLRAVLRDGAEMCSNLLSDHCTELREFVGELTYTGAEDVVDWRARAYEALGNCAPSGVPA